MFLGTLSHSSGNCHILRETVTYSEKLSHTQGNCHILRETVIYSGKLSHTTLNDVIALVAYPALPDYLEAVRLVQVVTPWIGLFWLGQLARECVTLTMPVRPFWESVTSTVNTVNTFSTVTTVTNNIVKCQVLLFYSCRSNFFTKSTNRQTDTPTNLKTTRLLEPLRAA